MTMDQLLTSHSRAATFLGGSVGKNDKDDGSMLMHKMKMLSETTGKKKFRLDEVI